MHRLRELSPLWEMHLDGIDLDEVEWNTQPWHLYVVTGEVLDKIRKGNTERNVSGVPPSREIKTPNRGYEGPHREIQIEVFFSYYFKNFRLLKIKKFILGNFIYSNRNYPIKKLCTFT